MKLICKLEADIDSTASVCPADADDQVVVVGETVRYVEAV